MSRGPTLRASGPAEATRSSSAAESPMRSSPSSTATVAGTAPASRMRVSHSRPTSRPSPAGNPWATIVVSSATTGAPAASAAETSSETASTVTASPRAWTTQRAAASRPSSMPPTRKPAASASPAPVVSTTSHTCASCSSASPPETTTAPAEPRLSTIVPTAGARPSSCELLLVPEHDVRLQLLDLGQEALGPERADRRPGRQVDRDEAALARAPRAPPPRPPRRPACAAARSRRGRSRRSPQNHSGFSSSGAQLGGDPGVGDHRALAVRVDDGDDDAVPARRHRPEHLDAAGADLGGDEPAGRVAAPLGDQPRLGAERSCPRGHVRRLPARARTGDRGRVVPARERPLDPDDQVEHQVAECADDHA